MMLSFLFVAFGVLWVWSKHGSTERELLERQKEEAKYAYTLKAAEIQVSYPPGSALYRGQSLCPDFCDTNHLRDGDYICWITNGQAYIQNDSDGTKRLVDFGRCDSNRSTKSFGLSVEGSVFRKVAEGDHVYQCVVEEGPFVAIVLEKEGRLKYLR